MAQFIVATDVYFHGNLKVQLINATSLEAVAQKLMKWDELDDEDKEESVSALEWMESVNGDGHDYHVIHLLRTFDSGKPPILEEVFPK